MRTISSYTSYTALARCARISRHYIRPTVRQCAELALLLGTELGRTKPNQRPIHGGLCDLLRRCIRARAPSAHTRKCTHGHHIKPMRGACPAVQAHLIDRKTQSCAQMCASAHIKCLKCARVHHCSPKRQRRRRQLLCVCATSRFRFMRACGAISATEPRLPI